MAAAIVVLAFGGLSTCRNTDNEIRVFEGVPTIRYDGNVRIDDLALRFIGFDEGGRYMFGS